MKLFFIIVFILGPNVIYAQDIDLTEALSQVLKNHPLIESSQYQVTAATKQIRPLYIPCLES